MMPDNFLLDAQGFIAGMAIGYTALDLYLSWRGRHVGRRIKQALIPDRYCADCGAFLQTYCPHNPRWQRLY